MTTHDESPIIRTSKKRLGQGLAIVVITMAVGAAIAVPYWNQMAEIPPPVSTIVIENPVPPEGEDELEIGTEETQEGETGAAPSTGGGADGGATPAAGTMITILAGSSVQGSPDYEPEDAEVPINENIVWVNEDTVPHTSTSGTGAEDPNSAKIFDTSIINGGEESAPLQLTGVKEGDEIPYYCQVHPYMTSKLTVVTSVAGDAVDANRGSNSTESNASSTLVENTTISNGTQRIESTNNDSSS